MQTFLYILTFALGVSLGTYLTFRFRKPTTSNTYKGKVKTKIVGNNNNVSTKFEWLKVTENTKGSEFRELRRGLKSKK